MRQGWAAVLGLWVLSSWVLAEEPLAVRNGRAFSLAFLRLTPTTSVGIREAGLRFILANDVRIARGRGGRVTEDYEVARWQGFYRKPISASTDLEVRLGIQSIGGGILDPLIKAWHDSILNWTRRERKGAGFGDVVIESPGNRRFGSAVGLTDVELQLNHAISKNVLSAGIKVPTGDASALLGSGGFDAGIGIGFELFELKRLSGSGQAAAIWQGPSGTLTGVRRFVDQEALSLSYKSRGQNSWIVQWQSEASALRLGIPASDATHRIIVFGFRRGYSNGRLELWFAEDRDLFEGQIRALADVGPDFSFGVNWVARR